MTIPDSKLYSRKDTIDLLDEVLPIADAIGIDDTQQDGERAQGLKLLPEPTPVQAVGIGDG